MNDMNEKIKIHEIISKELGKKILCLFVKKVANCFFFFKEQIAFYISIILTVVDKINTLDE